MMSDQLGEPVSVQYWELDGRQLTLSWFDGPVLPPRELTTQSYGFCVTAEGAIVLVAGESEDWNLPGGHPEGNETLEQALAREVWEEACAVVVDSRYIGCQRVDDPAAPDGLARYYQARFWARVELRPFEARFETTRRRLVLPGDFLTTLYWGSEPSARSILELGMAVEQQMTSSAPPATLHRDI